MHGVPENLDLSFLHSAELIQLCLGLHDVQLRFHPTGEISIDGTWELLGSSGRALASGGPAEAWGLHRLVGMSVTGTKVDSPASISLEFGNGLTLRILDRENYEAFTIWPGGI